MWRTLTKLALIAVIAFFGSKIVDVLVYESAPPPAHADETLPPALAVIAAEDAAQQILDRNVTHARVEPTPVAKETLCADAEHIVGTVAANRNEWSYVLYRDPRTQDTEVYSPRAGRDRLPSGATLLTVEDGEVRLRVRDHVEICSIGGGAVEALPDDTQAIRQISAHEWQIHRNELARVVSTLQTEARVVPAFAEHEPIGFKLFAVAKQSFVSRAGFESGDTLIAVNGLPLTSPGAAIDAYESLKTSTLITVRLLRKGATIDHTYRLR